MDAARNAGRNRESCGINEARRIAGMSAIQVAPAGGFETQLFDAWRARELDAAPRPSGGITFCCPKCTNPTRLEVSNEVARCPECDWMATGTPEAIADAAGKAAGANSTLT